MFLLEHIGGLPQDVRVSPANFVWWWMLLFGVALVSALVMLALPSGVVVYDLRRGVCLPDDVGYGYT